MTGRGQFPRSTQNVPQGTQLNNMFEIDQLITAGGMGEVYRGHNIQTHDPVAIKIVLPEFAQDELILELFRKEARILNHLHHEAIVRYYVFSIDAALGLPFLVMEFVDGPSLAERIKTGPFDAASVAILQRHLADGLEKAHQAGVIHRDIAPDNVILPEGRVDRAKIIDFGIARSAAAGGTLLGGQFAGKYNFVSPEQLGLFDGNVTNRSDIYSLGLVLAACALGRPLDMSGSQVAVIEKRRQVPDLTGIDPPLRDLIEAMLQPDPNDRPRSMAEVADWPTYDGPEPQDFEKTRIYTSPPSRLPSRQPSHPPTRQPSSSPATQYSSPPVSQPSRPPASQRPHPPTRPPSHVHAASAQESSRPPSGHPAPSPVDPQRDSTRPPTPAAPTQRPRQVERRREKRKSRAGLIAGGLAVTAFLVAAVGGWAYVEWSDTPFLTAEPDAPAIVDETVNQPETSVAETPEAETPEAETPVTEAREPEPPEPEPPEPETPEPEVSEPRFTEADIRDHVNSHDGGNCYFAFPAEIGDGRAEIVGYGNQRTPFDALRNSLRERFGFDAAIDLRSVSDDQCVMVEALDRLATADASPVNLDLSHSVLRSGGSLSGTISGLGERHLSLLMLDNFGFVHDLAGYVTENEGTATFEIEQMTTASQMDFQPQLVLSIASAEPLQSLDLAQSLPASELLPGLLEEIASESEGLATDIGYFKFGS